MDIHYVTTRYTFWVASFKWMNLMILLRVLCFIQDNPGCHLRRIKRAMNVSMGTVQYQLDKLEKMGRITSSRRGLYTYYFAAGL